MKQNFRLVALLLSVLLLAGCSPDDNEPEGQQEEQGEQQQDFLLTVSPDAFSFDGRAHATQDADTKFVVKNLMNSAVTVTVEADAQAWLAIAKTGETASASLTIPANTEMDIYLSMTRNNTGLPRQGTIAITRGTAVKNIVVKQDFVYYLVGDYYPDPDAVYSDGVLQSGTAAIGIVFWLDTDAPDYKAASESGPSGKIVSLVEPTSARRWGPSDYEGTRANSYIDGLANMAAVKKLDNTFNAYPAFAWVDKKNGAAGTTTYTSGAKEIWYLPAVAELQYLLCAAADQPYETWRFPGSDNSDSYYPSFSNQFGLSSFNSKLTSAGGNPVSAGSYWISTEFNIDYAWYVDFHGGYTHVPKTGHPRVRCVREF